MLDELIIPNIHSKSKIYIAMRSRAFIHDRMPLILPEQYVGEWIKPKTRPEELVKEAQTEMYFEKE